MARIGKFRAVIGEVCGAESRKILSAKCSCEECDSAFCFTKRRLNIKCSCEDCKNKGFCLGFRNILKNTYTDEILAVYLKSSKPTISNEFSTSLENNYDYESERQAVSELNQPPNSLDEYISKLLFSVIPKYRYKVKTLSEYIEKISGKANFKQDAYIKELKRNNKPLNAEHKLSQNVVDYSEVNQNGEVIHCRPKSMDSESCKHCYACNNKISQSITTNSNYVATEYDNNYEADRKAIIKVNRPPPSSIDEYISNLLSDGEPLLRHKNTRNTLSEYIAVISQNSGVNSKQETLNGYIQSITDNKLNLIERKSITTAGDFISSTEYDDKYEAYRECIFESNQDPPNSLEEYISTLIYDGEALPKYKTKPGTLTEYIDIVSENAYFKNRQESLNTYVQKIKGNKPLNPNERIALKSLKQIHTIKYKASKINSSKSKITSDLVNLTEYDCSKYESDRRQIIETNKSLTNLLCDGEPVLHKNKQKPSSNYIEIVSEHAKLKIKRCYSKEKQLLVFGEKMPKRNAKQIKIEKCSKKCKQCTKKVDKDNITQIQRVMLTSCTPNYKSVPMPFRKFSNTICASCNTSHLSTFSANKTDTNFSNLNNGCGGIYQKIKEIYDACTCKVCECIPMSMLNNDVCSCKPCECADCTRYMTKFKIKQPVDLKLYQSFIMAKTCSCKPCQCYDCSSLMQSKLNNKMEKSFDDIYKPEKKDSIYNLDVLLNDTDALVKNQCTSAECTEKTRQFDIRTASIINDLYEDHNRVDSKQDNSHSFFSKLSYRNTISADSKIKGCSCEQSECITCVSKDCKNRSSASVACTQKKYGGINIKTSNEAQNITNNFNSKVSISNYITDASRQITNDKKEHSDTSSIFFVDEHYERKLHNPETASYPYSNVHTWVPCSQKIKVEKHGLKLNNLPKHPSCDEYGLSNNNKKYHSKKIFNPSSTQVMKNAHIEKELEMALSGHTIISDAFVQCREFDEEKFLVESASVNSHYETASNASNKLQVFQNFNKNTTIESCMNSLSNLNCFLHMPETVVDTHLSDEILKPNWLQGINSSTSTHMKKSNKQRNKTENVDYSNSDRYATQPMKHKRKVEDYLKLEEVNCYSNAQGHSHNCFQLLQNINPISYSSQIINETLDFCKDKRAYPVPELQFHSPYSLNLDINMVLLSLDEDFNRVKKVLQDAMEYSLYLLKLLETYEKANQDFKKISDTMKPSRAIFDLELSTTQNKNKENAKKSNSFFSDTITLVAEKLSKNIHEQSDVSSTISQNLGCTSLSKDKGNKIHSSAVDAKPATNVNVRKHKNQVSKHNILEINNEQVFNDNALINASHNKSSQILLTEHIIDLVTDGTKRNKKLKLSYNKKEKLCSRYCKKHSKPLRNKIIITKRVGSKKSSLDCLPTKLSNKELPLLKSKDCSSKDNKEETIVNTTKLDKVIHKLVSVFDNTEDLCHASISVGKLENANILSVSEGLEEINNNKLKDATKKNVSVLGNVENLSFAATSAERFKNEWTNLSLNIGEDYSLTSNPSKLKRLGSLNLKSEHPVQPQSSHAASLVQFKAHLSHGSYNKLVNKDEDENKNIELPKKSIPILKELLKLENNAQTVSCNEIRIDNKVKFLMVRKVSEHSALIKWSQPRDLTDIKGYELLVDGRAVQHIFNPSKCLAVVTCLPHTDKILLTIRTISCVDSKSNLYPSSTIVYQPRV